MNNSFANYQELLVETSHDGAVTHLVINRPDRLNAITARTADELTDAFTVAGDDPAVGVVTLKGAGRRAFCTGGDLGGEESLTPQDMRVHMGRHMRLSQAIRNCGKPVIAAVHGWCLAGGNELNMLCDLALAGESARFGHAGPKVGSAPIWFGTQMMPRVVGERRAKEIIFMCRHFSAAEAKEMGWVNAVVPDDDLDSELSKWCDELLEKSPLGLRVSKLSINFESDQLTPSLNHGAELLAMMHGTEEVKEGMRAFLDKRQPDFGRFRQ